MISIKTKLIAIFLVVIIVPIFIMTINSYLASQSLLEQKYTTLMLDIAQQSNVRIDEFINEIEKISLIVSYGVNSYVSASSQEDYPVQNFLRSSTEENENAAYRVLMNYILMKDRTFSIYLYNLNGGHDLFISSNQPIDYTYRAVKEPWFQDFLASEDKVMILDTHLDKQARSDNYVISHVRKIFDMQTGRLLGVMVVSMDIRFIEFVSNRLQESLRSGFTIVDKNDTIIYHENTELIGHHITRSVPFHYGAKRFGQIIERSSDHLIVKVPFDDLPWSTYLHVPLHEVSSEGVILRNNFLYLAALLFIFSVFTFIFSSNVITRPIKRLMNNMTLVEKGRFDNLAVIRSRDEIGHLSLRFNQMSLELKQLIRRIHQEETEKAAAEVKALQAQINPHFLYNTLGSIKWIASMQRSDKIVEMTEALISMLRYVARDVGSLVTLAEELDNVNNYVTIQNVRYYNRIHVKDEVDESLLQTPIPKMTLQPLVENAVFHGFAETEEDGIICIRVYREQEDVIVEVEDNGVGMDERTLQELNGNRRNLSQGEAKGIGLDNVRRRIQLHFGTRYNVTYESKLGEGTKCTIRLPSHMEFKPPNNETRLSNRELP